jgi:5-methylcytosine-specific restriction protein A
MPSLRSCSDCGRIAEGKRCPECEAKRPKRPTYRQRGYGAEWDKLSKAYRVRHPVCELPGCDKPSKAVDHIDNRGPNGPRGYDESNLQALCWSHHSQKTARETPGGWNAINRAKP